MNEDVVVVSGIDIKPPLPIAAEFWLAVQSISSRSTNPTAVMIEKAPPSQVVQRGITVRLEPPMFESNKVPVALIFTSVGASIKKPPPP
jgi:hypothetical protein